MELWLSTLINAVIAGAIVLWLTTVVKKNSKTAEDNAALKDRAVQRELAYLLVRFVSMEQKHDKTINVIDDLKSKIVRLITQNENLKEQILDVGRKLEVVQAKAQDHGKVIRK